MPATSKGATKKSSSNNVSENNPIEGCNQDQIFRQITGSARLIPIFEGDKEDVGPL
jgi:hypothetical protein